MIPIPDTYVNKRPSSELFLGENSEVKWSTEESDRYRTAQKIVLSDTQEPKKEDAGKERISTTFEKKSKDGTNNVFEDQVPSEDYATLRGFKKQKYSDAYIEHEVALLISSLQKDFESWIEKGTPESYAEISNIKNSLEIYSEYLEAKDETRVLLGSLEMLFQNENWRDFSEAQLNLVSFELRRFRNGEINFTSLEKFYKQLWQGKILL